MTTIDLDLYRRFFAEEIQITSNLRTPGLVEALATVPRERFLAPGPWIIRSEADFQAPPRQTPGDDPRFVYHNVAVAIDPARMLFNGAPGFLTVSIDALALAPGHRVLHIGAGTGYYTALMARTVGATGHVLAIEVDATLAGQATTNLRDLPWVDVRHGDGRDLGGANVDAIFVNAGVTHPEPAWLQALAPGGRMMLPLTASLAMPGMPAGSGPMANISKGLMVLVTRAVDERFDARVVTFVAIYSATGLRDEAANAELGRALAKMPFPPLRRFRRDAHDAEAACWCHTAHGCWSTAG